MNKDDLYSSLLNSNIICLMCSPLGQIIQISENIYQLTGNKNDFYLGKPIFTIVGEEHGETLKNTLLNVSKNNKPHSFSFTSSTSLVGLSRFTLQVCNNPDVGFFCMIIPDFEYNTSTEYAIRQMEVMRTTLASMEDFVFVLDSQGLFSEFYAEKNYELTGFFSAFRVGASISESGFPDDIAKQFMSAFHECKKTGLTQQFNYSLQVFRGELFYQAKISPRFTSKDDFDGTTVVVRDITSLVKSEKNLKKSLEYYLTVLDNFPNLIWRASKDKQIDYVNKTWLTFTGKAIEEELGKGWHNSIYIGDRERVVKEYETNFDTHKPFSLEYRMQYFKGGHRWVMDFCEPLFDLKGKFSGYIGSCFDIDDIRRTERLLQESESRYRLMVEEQNDLVIRWSSDTRLTFVNKAYSKALGKKPKDLLGKKWLDFFSNNTRKSEILDYIKSPKEGDSKFEVFEMEIFDSNNRRRTFQWLSSPIYDSNGNFIEFQSVARDITDKILKQKENQTLLKELNEKIKELSLLNKVSGYINRNMVASKLLQKLVDDIPLSFINPGKTYAIIHFDGHVYGSNTMDCNQNFYSEKFSFGDSVPGVIEIHFDPKSYTGLHEKKIRESERDIIRVICKLLTTYFLKINTEKLLIESELRYRELFNNVLDIVFSINEKGQILRVNVAAEKILGNQIMEGQFFGDFIVPSERIKIRQQMEKIFSHKTDSFSFETRAICADGKIKYLQINGFIKYIDKNKPSEVFGVARDITEHRLIEKNIMKTVLITEERERRRFAEELHDGLGPLLSGLKLYLQQDNLTQNLNSKQLKVFNYSRELVDEAIHQTRSIANNLMPSVLSDFGLQKAMQSFVEKINQIGKVKINLKIDSCIDNVEADESLVVYRVLSELINNALKHSECDKIEIQLDIKNNILNFFYADDGKGFDVNDVLSKQERKGIGLYNVFNRINSLNGTISMESKNGKGTLAKIFIPLRHT